MIIGGSVEIRDWRRDTGGDVQDVNGLPITVSVNPRESCALLL